MPVDILFRRAIASDVPALHALIESAYRGESAKGGWTHEADLLGGQRTDLDALRDIIADPDQIILVASDDERTGDSDRIIGCVQLSRRTDDMGYLGLLTVAPNLQAAGLGKRLLTAAEEFGRNHWGICTVEMTVIRQRSELIAYYERRGYIVTDESRPFPLDDPRFGLPKSRELEFLVLRKTI